MEQRRVTLICSAFPPETGAAPGRMYHMALLLRQRGFSVTVLTAMPNYPTGRIFKAYRNKLIHTEDVDGIRVSRIWLIPSNAKSVWKRFFSGITYAASIMLLMPRLLLRSRPDLVIVSSPPFVTGYCGLLIAAFTRAIKILNVSDLWPGSMLDLGVIRYGWRYRTLKRFEYAMYRRADAVMGQSEEILSEIAKQTNAPAFLYRNLHPGEATALKDRPEGKRKLIYAGLLGVAQGVLDICRSIDFSRLGTELHIYGEGYEKDAIVAFIDQHPHRGIFYHCSLPAAAMPEIFSCFHASLIPLKTNIPGAVPSKIFNAIANGLPVMLGADGEGAQLVAQHGIGFTSPAGDYDALQDNVRQLVAMEAADYEALRRRCLAVADGVFNKSGQDEAFVGFLEGLNNKYR